MKNSIISIIWMYILSLIASLISFVLSFITIFKSEYSLWIISLCTFLLLGLFFLGGLKCPKSFYSFHHKDLIIHCGIYSFILCLFYFLSISGIPVLDTVSAFSIYFLFTGLFFFTDFVSYGLFSFPSFLFILFFIVICMTLFYLGIQLKMKRLHR